MPKAGRFTKRKRYRFKLEEFLDDVYWAVAQFNVTKQQTQTDHELVIRLRRRHGKEPLSWLCKQEAFSSLVFDTLRSWGVGQRGSKMVGRKEFYGRLQTLAESAAFEKIAGRLGISTDSAQKLWCLAIQRLRRTLGECDDG